MASEKDIAVVERFVESGDYLDSMLAAGYKNENKAVLMVQGRRIIDENSELLEQLFKKRMKSRGPRALMRIEGLMDHAESETVRLGAAKDLLDRAGYKAAGEYEGSRTIEEMEGQLVALVGQDGAKMLLGAFKMRKVGSGPEVTAVEEIVHEEA